MHAAYCLGIESTAHTFGASVVSKDRKVLSNVKRSFTSAKEGMIPTKVADHHIAHCKDVVEEALNHAHCTMKDIKVIAFSQGPGLGPSLAVGAHMARALSALHKIPLIGVNHCIAHLEIGRALSRARDPVLLYVSGANTQVIAYDGGKYRIFGETLDIGVGNFLDSFARALGLGFPGGPLIEKLARSGTHYIELPYSVKGMDMSFAGLLTNLKHKIAQGTYSKEDLAHSSQETAFAMLIEVSERAIAHCEKKELLLGGGVACNKRLQEMARAMCKEHDWTCHILENQYNVDNAAMIALTGTLMHPTMKKHTIKTRNTAGERSPSGIHSYAIRPYERTDDVHVTWR